MFARARLPFHPAPVPASRENSLSPIIPTLARLFRKSNHSRTYGTPGFLVRPIRLVSKPSVPLHTKFLHAILLFPLLTQKQGLYPPPQNVAAATFLIFPLFF